MRVKLLILSLFCVFAMNSQVITGEKPISWTMQSKKSITPMLMKKFDLNKINAEDAKNDRDQSIPWRFGYEYKVNYGLDNSGVWEELSNGDRIWRINIISKGAKTLNFIFDTYKMPEGAKMYLYNDDKTDLLGAYTSVFNRPDHMLGTWLVEGDNIWVEYYEPASVKGQGELNIAKVIHGYRSVTDAEIQKKIGSSGDCNLDVDCSLGKDYDSLKERLKHSVALVIIGKTVCTGTLINNTRNDKTPYFLTANHCAGVSESVWAFRFNWISPNPSCATEVISTDTEVNQVTSGATLLASNPQSDFKLLRLDGGLDESWDLEWAGWDRTSTTIGSAMGIHHPDGDIMKTCLENDELDNRVITIPGIPDPIDSWVVGDWDKGVTEQGSSGSALFNQKGHIIGQLSGGRADCIMIQDSINDNGEEDYYGRFNVSWDFGKTDDTRLSNWLDPDNKSKTGTLNMLSQELSGVTPKPEPPQKEIVVFFKSDRPEFSISNGVKARLKYYVYNIFGALVASGELAEDTAQENVNMLGKLSGMYFVYIENTTNGTSLTKKIIIDNKI
ncbi:trypsin-like peptidase domain-containing protein [Aquimarina longa]|uniref:trypsin-like peptidase domain-containing protein n=1 Tax=Aquimarina longa TaxID=1080221 RepID=UPI00130DE1C7|nr:trypsin-like peptidase domain-containing protein [Aquimarina longa]